MLDPELPPLMANYVAFDPDTMVLTDERRARAARMPCMVGEYDGVIVEERWIEVPRAIPLRLLIFRPIKQPGPLPVLLHMHGGGYILGTPEIAHADNCSRSRRACCVVISVDYPLAPDAPYPAAIEACYQALLWVRGSAASIGGDARRIAVGGESAGGGLAASLALLARERGGIPIAFQLLIYPMIDDRTGHGPGSDLRSFAIWSAKANRFGWRSLLGGQADDPPVFAVPARARDLEGLPAAYIAVGSEDLFLAEDAAYALRLIQAGVPVDFHVFAGGCHGFDTLGPSRLGTRFKDLATEALRRAFWPEHRSDQTGALPASPPVPAGE